MWDYLIMKVPIENENALKKYKPNEWMKLDWVACATIQMHLFEFVYYIVSITSIAY